MHQLKISEWLKTLPEPYKERALLNFNTQEYHNRICNSISEALELAFSWDRTPEKEYYWNELFDKLELGELQLTQPTPVNTWIPVKDLGKYQLIDANKDVICCNEYNWWPASPRIKENGSFNFETDRNGLRSIIAIMIVEPYKPTNNASTD